MQLQETQLQKFRSSARTSARPSSGLSRPLTFESAKNALATLTPPSEATMATTLGIVSLLLGTAEVALTRPVARVSGLDEKYLPILRVFGLREISSGLGLLLSSNKRAWLWSRVIGDALDSAFLGWAFFNERSTVNKKKIAIAFASILPIVAADLFSVLRPSRT